MNRGKNICKHLKEIRKRIAEENDIPLEIKECTYKGECRGTCPRCEAEMRFLENALAEKIKIGKVAAIAGLTLGLASTTHAQAPENKGVPALDTTDVHRTECCGTLKGTVFDIKTQETLPFVNVGGNNVNIDYQVAYNVHGAPTMIILNEERRIIMNKVIATKEILPFLKRYEEQRKLKSEK